MTILVGSGTLTGITADSPNGKPIDSGRILARNSLSRRSNLATSVPRDR